MDYLIKKSDKSVVQKWGGTATKVQLPEQTGGDVVFTGDKRPVDLGDYILVEAKEVNEPLDDTKKRGPTTEKVTKKTVTVTRTAVAKTEAELATAYRDARRDAYPPIGDQLDSIWKELNYRRLQGEDLVQDADDMLGAVLAVKSAHPKPE